ncbi:MAG TPA: 4-hydroxy-3-methylbut-2-enyl diphosphate reductase, partial [Gammaproteobacteria bacterium]|nr:4-hydroxy-3-methylbut-2-enyl diphosphate reductase [Gammaproteobacteria bacterium]
SAYLIDGPDDIQRAWLGDAGAVGVTAGASAPELLVQQVVARLREWGGRDATEAEGTPEHVVFALPKVLRRQEG